MGFIYMLTSPSGKVYNGQTIRPIHERFKEHQDPDSGCPAIAGAIQKHGWEKIIADYYECPDNELNKHETWMVRLLGTLSPGGYNLREGGGGRGKFSEETKKKMSEAQRGEKHPMYGKKISEEPNYGKQLSEETKQKISFAHKGEKSVWFGKTHSEETKKKMSEARTGKKLSEETKQKLREARTGNKLSEETKQKIGNAQKGKIISEETRQKLSDINRGDNHPFAKAVYAYGILYGSCVTASNSLRFIFGSKYNFIKRYAHSKNHPEIFFA